MAAGGSAQVVGGAVAGVIRAGKEAESEDSRGNTKNTCSACGITV